MPIPAVEGTWSELIDRIHARRRFLVSSHIHPDGDAIGSSLAFKRMVESLGKEVQWVMDSDPGPMFARFYQPSELDVFQAGGGDFSNRDAIVMVDACEWSRLGKLGEVLQSHPADKICVDHHLPKDSFAGLQIADPSSPSTTVLLYRLLRKMEIRLTKEIAEPIYLGLIVDTQNFHLPNTTVEAHQIAAECLRAGVDPTWVHEPIFGTNRFSRLRLIAEAFQTAQVYFQGAVAVMVTTQAMFRDAGAAAWEDEGFSDWVRTIEGVKVGIYIREESDGRIKVSWRAKGDNNVAVSARRFGGGGHLRAAGAIVEGKLEEVRERVLADLKQRLENGEIF